MQRGQAGVGDGAGRQAGYLVGIVGRVHGQVGSVEGGFPPRIRPRLIADGILHRRIGLQRHPRRQPFQENSGHERLLFGQRGLLLDNRSQNDGFAQRQPQRAVRLAHDRRHLLVEVI